MYCRMDMVINAGKSRKNVDAFVLLPPDARQAIDVLLNTRSRVGVPPTNGFIFARLSADTPMTGHVELQELAQKCDGLRFPDRITSRRLRTYIATVSQVWTFPCDIAKLKKKKMNGITQQRTKHPQLWELGATY
jgi:hypothetical protein